MSATALIDVTASGSATATGILAVNQLAGFASVTNDGSVLATATNAGFTGTLSANDTALLSMMTDYYAIDNTATPSDSFTAVRLNGLTDPFFGVT